MCITSLSIPINYTYMYVCMKILVLRYGHILEQRSDLIENNYLDTYTEAECHSLVC